MLKTENENQQVHRHLMFQFCITLLAGAVQIFREYVYHKIDRIPQEDHDEVSPIMESYLFGGQIGWYRLAQNETEVFLPQLAMLFVLIVYRSGHHTRRKGMIKMLL